YSGFFFLQSTLAYTVFYDTKLIFVLESVALFVSELLIVFFLESIFIEKISLFGKLNGVITLIISSSVLIAPQFGPFCHDVFYFTELMMAIWVFYILVIGLHRSYKNIFSSNNFGSSIREKFRCFVRTLFTTLPGNVSFGFFATLTAVLLEFSNYYIFHIQTYLFLQTITAFLIGMNLVLVNRFETAIRNEAMTEVKIEEEKKRFELEKELSLVKEREKIYGDIHDHLGSKLVDIQMMLRRFHENKIPEVQVLEHMNRLVNSTIGSLKERLINLEDYELFQSDFINGIHLILIRRYSGAGKILEYWGDPSLSVRIKNFSEKWKKEFHAIIGEFVTNDLKYGKGKSTWKISITNMDGIEKLELNFVSGTDYTKSGLFSGRGTESINSRLQNISGENLSKLENDVFHGKILISI
ncbi:MAG: hypothetical protein K8R21_05005, partial [Leptospira sp.]|nr:hypothetical protein [Leptospira sp.]